MDIPATEPLDPTAQLVASVRALLRPLREGHRTYTVSPEGDAKVLVDKSSQHPGYAVLRLIDAEQPAEVEAATFGPELLGKLCDSVETLQRQLATARLRRTAEEGLELAKALRRTSVLASAIMGGVDAFRAVAGLAVTLVPSHAEGLLRRAVTAEAELAVSRRNEATLRLVGEVLSDADRPLVFEYVNWEGRFDVNRRAFGFHNLRFGTTEHHTKPQWLVSAMCMHKHALRDFAIASMSGARKMERDGAGDWTDPVAVAASKRANGTTPPPSAR